MPRIEADDRAKLCRLLRYCARPPFAVERLEDIDTHPLIYHLPKPSPDGCTELLLSPLELIQRLAALIPPTRAHRHRYHGVLAPNATLRAPVTALAREASNNVQELTGQEKESTEDAVEGLWNWVMYHGFLLWQSPFWVESCPSLDFRQRQLSVYRRRSGNPS